MALFKKSSQYVLLAQTLLKQIESGVYPKGSLLPSESTLGQQFNVSRITVRSALHELETRGLVSRRAGIGTRVESVRPQGQFLHAGSSIDEILQFTRGKPFKTLSTTEITITPDISTEMELTQGQRFIKVCGCRQAGDDLPIMYSEHYIPSLYAGSVSEFDGYAASIAELVALRTGQIVQTIRQSTSAVNLDDQMAEKLSSVVGSACLKTRRWYCGRDGTLLMAASSLFPADRFVFTSVLRRSQGE